MMNERDRHPKEETNPSPEPGGISNRPLEGQRAAHEEAMLAWLADRDGASHSVSDGGDSDVEVVRAELVGEQEPTRWPLRRPVRALQGRRKALPLILFIATCLSTFIAGACVWIPWECLARCALMQNLMPLRRVLVVHWDEGLIYMGCVLAILLTHEMGHFLAALRYRIPASYPYFLPLPISPIGTLGAVIGMDGARANRREIFDIGIAGPLAGLVVAIPILWIGILKLDFTEPSYGVYELHNPLIIRLALEYLNPPGYVSGQGVLHGQLNPFFMAGWVGLLVTGLNMMPVSQLDGGHVIYCLLGRRSYWVARGFVLLAIGYILISGTMSFLLMIVLIMLVGTDHPPTRDDTVRLGWFRVVLGFSSLAIPILCFAPRVLTVFTP